MSRLRLKSYFIIFFIRFLIDIFNNNCIKIVKVEFFKQYNIKAFFFYNVYINYINRNVYRYYNNLFLTIKERLSSIILIRLSNNNVFFFDLNFEIYFFDLNFFLTITTTIILTSIILYLKVILFRVTFIIFNDKKVYERL